RPPGSPSAGLERRGARRCARRPGGARPAARSGPRAAQKFFARHIIKPDMLYERVVEVAERVRADGTVEQAPDLDALRVELERAHADGLEAAAIAFMHAYRYPEHERRVAALAREVGFAQVSASHEVSPLIKLVSRGDTTVVDAYLSPILRRYVAQVAGTLNARRYGDAELDVEGALPAASPPPLWGRDREGGQTDTELPATPLPTPPPQ